MTNGTQINVGGVLSRAWEVFQANWTEYVQVGAVVWVAILLNVALGRIHSLFSLVGGILLVGPVAIGAVSTLLVRARTGQFDLHHVADGFHMYPHAVVAIALLAVLYFLGLVACIIGVVPVAAMLLIYIPFICDHKDPIRAFESCWKFFLLAPWELMLLVVVLFAINVVGALAGTVGLIATMPYGFLVSITLYEEALRVQGAPPAPTP